ncbi:MAG: multicopper oxidase family protein [Rhodospirillaceae bacterium]
MTRRMFLSGSAALAAAGPRMVFAGRAEDVLEAKPAAADLGHPGGAKTGIWGYGGGTPGPVIRLKQGERLTRRFVNNLPQPSSVHWHGIRIANAMDGVPDITQPVVPPGGDFLYDFTVPDAGTYWYHPHNRTWEQLARGLYGALIVDEPNPPRVDRDEVLLIDDWRLGQDGMIHEDSFGSMGDWSHNGRLGGFVTVNGRSDYKARARSMERLRLRLVNTANARIFTLGLVGMTGWVVALDGQPLAKPEPVTEVTLAPAQRTDIIADITAPEKTANGGGEAFIYGRFRDQRIALCTLTVEGAARAGALPPPEPIATNPLPPLGNLGKAKTALLRMEGGAMGAMHEATFKGQRMGIRELIGHSRVWAFNGMAEMPKTPFLTARLGETIRIKMENLTAWPHAMHLHGHHFKKVGADGTTGPFRDTLLMQPEETAEIAFVADNPGKWLMHCHMVEHSASGMMTWLLVS